MITAKAIRIRTRIVKDTFVEDREVHWERTTKSIVVTTMDENVDLTTLHDFVVQMAREA